MNIYIIYVCKVVPGKTKYTEEKSSEKGRRQKADQQVSKVKYQQ